MADDQISFLKINKVLLYCIRYMSLHCHLDLEDGNLFFSFFLFPHDTPAYDGASP